MALIEHLALVGQGEKVFQLNISLFFLYKIVNENSKSTVMPHFLPQTVYVLLICKYI